MLSIDLQMEGRERVDDRGRGHSAAAEEHRRLHGVRCGGEADDYHLQSNPVDFSTRRRFLIAHTICRSASTRAAPAWLRSS